MEIKVREYVSKNGRLSLVNRGYNNKIYINGTSEMLVEFTDTCINARVYMEEYSKAFD